MFRVGDGKTYSYDQCYECGRECKKPPITGKGPYSDCKEFDDRVDTPEGVSFKIDGLVLFEVKEK